MRTLGAGLVAIACAGLAACTTSPDVARPPSPPATTAVSPPTTKEPPTAAVRAVPAPAPKPRPAPEPEPEAAKEPPRNLGHDELAKGLRSYDDGDYAAAARQLQAALDLGLVSAKERASAHKHLAFIACVTKRTGACRSEFRKAFAADPAFDLTRAEAGHPTWGPVFRSVRAEVAKSRAKPARKT